MKMMQECRLLVSEMWMLQWVCRLTGKVRVKNEHIRGSLGIASIDEESGLTWFEHSTRRWSKEPILESFANGSGGGGCRWSQKRACIEVIR